MFFVHIHNSCTRGSDYLILLIKTGIAHKQRISPQTITNICKKCEGRRIETGLNYDGGKMVVVFTTTETDYFIVSPFFDLLVPR